MPTVPQYQRQSQSQAAPVMVSNLRVPENPVPAALQGLAQDAINIYGQEKKKADDSQFQDLTLKLNGVIQDQQLKQSQLLGQNALGSAPAAIQAYHQAVGELGVDLPDSMKDAWRRQVEAGALQLNGVAERHEFSQMQQYRENQIKAVEDNGVTEAASYINDPYSFQLSRARTREQIMRYYQSQGASDEQLQAKLKDFDVKAGMAAANARIGGMFSSLMGPNGSIPVTGNTSDDQIFTAMVRAESGGQHYGADGQLLTSPAGARGIAQIMPDTGVNPGFGIKPLKDDSPAEHLRVGRQYYGAMINRYGGNQALAVAAYNAGPGTVDKWIEEIGDPRKGQITDADFIARMPAEETKNYVSSVLGSASGVPPQAAFGALMNEPFMKMIGPENSGAVFTKVSGILDASSAQGRLNLQNRMQDNLTQIDQGLPVTNPVTAREWASFMPLTATPSERQQLQQSFDHYQGMMQLQPVYQEINQGTEQQGLAAVEMLKPTGKEADVTFAQQRYAQAVAKLQQVSEARRKDPGGWLLKNSDATKSAYQQFAQGQVNGDFLVSSIQAEKERLGIPSAKVIPDAIADQIGGQLESDATKYADVQGILSGFGRFSGPVIAQVQNKIKGPVGVALGVNDPNAASLIFNLKNTSTQALRDNAGDNAKAAELAWSTSAVSISPTFAMQQRGGAGTLNDLNEQGKRLSYYYVSKGMSPDAAAKRAYTQMLGDHYVVHDTWRMPNSLNLNEDNVVDGLDHFKNSLKPSDIGSISATYNPAMTPEMNAANNLAQIKNSAEWVTDENETGVYLTVNGANVKDKNGNFINVPFAEANKLGVANMSTTNKIMTRMRAPTKVTPADGFRNPNINATMADAYRVLQGQGVREVNPPEDIIAPSSTLGDALSHRSGQ